MPQVVDRESLWTSWGGGHRRLPHPAPDVAVPERPTVGDGEHEGVVPLVDRVAEVLSQHLGKEGGDAHPAGGGHRLRLREVEEPVHLRNGLDHMKTPAKQGAPRAVKS